MNPNPMDGGFRTDAFGAMVAGVRKAGKKKGKRTHVVPKPSSSSPPPHHASKHHPRPAQAVKGRARPGVALLKDAEKKGQ